MGGGKRQREPQASKAQAQIAQQMFNETQPLRDLLISDSISFLGGDPAQASPNEISTLPKGLQGKLGDQPAAAPMIRQEPNFNAAGTPEFRFVQDAANRRFDQAKQNILQNTPRGGVLIQNLAEADLERARTLTGAEADIFNQNIGRAFSLATGQPFTGGGLGTAGAIQAQIASANASQNAAAKGGIGQGLGIMAGARLGGKGGAGAAGAAAGA